MYFVEHMGALLGLGQCLRTRRQNKTLLLRARMVSPVLSFALAPQTGVVRCEAQSVRWCIWNREGI